MFSKYELLFLNQANSSSDPSQIIIPQFPVNSLSNFTFTNWNPPQHNPHHVLHQFPYFVLPHSITSHHKYWIYQTICKVKPTKFNSRIYAGQTRYPWKRGVFKSPFSFKVRQHSQQHFYLQCKVCWIHYKMVGTPSFSQPYLCMQINATISTKNPSFYLSQFSPPYSTLTCSQNRHYNSH